MQKSFEKSRGTMDKKTERQGFVYTCNEYREEMMLLTLRRKLQNDGLDEDERRRLGEEIARLEKHMGMD